MRIYNLRSGNITYILMKCKAADARLYPSDLEL